jgi:DNA-binding NarL/FixJ family response regulator
VRWRLLELLASSGWLATAGGGEVRQSPPPKGSPPITSRGPSVLVVESHSLVGAAVGGLLSGPPLDAFVETVLDTQTAMARLDAAEFDLVLCELSDPPKRATELVARLAARNSDVPVVFLADAEEEQLLMDSLKSGAIGFFTMDCAPEEFIEGLSSVLHGHYTVGTRLKRGVRARLASASTAAAPRSDGRRHDDTRK